VRELLWPQFVWSAWAKPATVVEGTTVEGGVLAAVRSEAWARSATIVAGTKFEGAVLACVRSNGVGSASYCGGGHEL
jgi:hypothetical protein